MPLCAHKIIKCAPRTPQAGNGNEVVLHRVRKWGTWVGQVCI